MSEACLICKSTSGCLVTLTAKGMKTLQTFSKKRDEQDIHAAILASENNKNNLHVHELCRKSFTDKRKLLKDKGKSNTRKTTP